jgi:hypothetical protein
MKEAGEVNNVAKNKNNKSAQNNKFNAEFSEELNQLNQNTTGNQNANTKQQKAEK